MNKDRLTELLAIPIEQLEQDKDLKAELIEYYKFIYGVKVCTSCKNKFPTYYKKLMENGIEKLTESLCVFRLRKDLGVIQINFGDSQFISQSEADFDTCIGFLKANPNRISMFEKYPENWKQLIQDNENNNAND